MSEWVWDEATATRWAALRADLKAAQVTRRRVRDSEDPVARGLVNAWCDFCFEQMNGYVDGDMRDQWVANVRVRDQLEELWRTEALSALMRSEVAGSDQYFLSTTRHDENGLIVGCRHGDDHGSDSWWWTRRPVDGPFADYFDQLAP